CCSNGYSNPPLGCLVQPRSARQSSMAFCDSTGVISRTGSTAGGSAIPYISATLLSCSANASLETGWPVLLSAATADPPAVLSPTPPGLAHEDNALRVVSPMSNEVTRLLLMRSK